MKKKLSLPQQIIIALILGVVVGLVCYFTQTQDFTKNFLKPFGDIFVNLLKFIVVPVVSLLTKNKKADKERIEEIFTCYKEN